MSIQIDGREYERVETAEALSDDTEMLFIRPVKVEPKWEVDLTAATTTGYDSVVRVFLEVSEDQAQLIKEAVEELMEYVTGGADWTLDFDKLSKARHSIMRENN